MKDLATKVVLHRFHLKGSDGSADLQRVATFYLSGKEFSVYAPPAAKGLAPDWVSHFTVRELTDTYAEVETLEPIRSIVLKFVEEELWKYFRGETDMLESTEVALSRASTEAPRRVFVIHGRDQRLREGAFTFLRAIGLDPIEWIQAIRLTGKGSPHIAEILNAAFNHAQAVVVLLTPDDEARLRHGLLRDDDPQEERTLTGQARANVLFEAGMAFSSHENRTVLVQFGSIRPFSDVAGRHVVKMDNSVAKRHELAMKLKTAGCAVDIEGKDWQTSGDLTPPSIDANSSTPIPNDSQTASPHQSAKPRRATVAPVSRSTSESELTLEKTDDFGAVFRLSNGVQVRVPKADYIESWDDWKGQTKFTLTRKYFQGYLPGYEHATEYFLPR